MINIILKEVKRLSESEQLDVLYLLRNRDLISKINTAWQGQPSSRFNEIMQTMLVEHKQQSETQALLEPQSSAGGHINMRGYVC